MTASANTIGTRVTPVQVDNGGTGATSLTAYGVVCGGTTSTGAVQSIASVGTAGQVLTSNGAGALPTFQNANVGDITAVGDVTGGAAFDGTQGTTLTSTTAGFTITTATTAGAGADIDILPGASSGAAGGVLGLVGGAGSTAGGAAQMAGGNCTTSGIGGNVSISPGTSAAGKAGDTNIGGAGVNAVGTDIDGSNTVIFNPRGTGTGASGYFAIFCGGYGLSSGTTTQPEIQRFHTNQRRSLTNSTATNLIAVDVSTTSGKQFGSGTIFYSVECTDGTDYQTVSGQLLYSVVVTAGPTYTYDTEDFNQAKALSAGTLAVTSDMTTSGGITYVRITPVSSLTPTLFYVTYTVINNGHSSFST